MNKVQKQIKRKQWEQKTTDNIRKKKQLLEEIACLKEFKEAKYATK